jgi:hypothetical protein
LITALGQATENSKDLGDDELGVLVTIQVIYTVLDDRLTYTLVVFFHAYKLVVHHLHTTKSNQDFGYTISQV